MPPSQIDNVNNFLSVTARAINMNETPSDPILQRSEEPGPIPAPVISQLPSDSIALAHTPAVSETFHHFSNAIIICPEPQPISTELEALYTFIARKTKTYLQDIAKYLSLTKRGKKGELFVRLILTAKKKGLMGILLEESFLEKDTL
ncbi:unnamed protein product [Agarophyton chilense]